MSEQMYPTEEVTLPSKGLVYPLDNPLAKGTIEMKYMTAREEDILTNESYIKKGIVIDKLLESLIVTPINYGDLVNGDKLAVMIAARVLGYGSDYKFNIRNKEGKPEEHSIDLTQIDDKLLDTNDLLKENFNEFAFDLPIAKKKLTFKLLTHTDEKNIENEIKGLKRAHKEGSFELTTRLKHMITSIDGDSETKTIRQFVDTMLARDARSFRDYIKKVQPGVDLTTDITTDGGDVMEGVSIPIDVTFFWPDAQL